MTSLLVPLALAVLLGYMLRLVQDDVVRLVTLLRQRRRPPSGDPPPVP